MGSDIGWYNQLASSQKGSHSSVTSWQSCWQLVKTHILFSFNLHKYVCLFGQIHLSIWKRKFFYLDKYICLFGRIHLSIWTNTFSIWTNTFFYLDKYICQFGQIHFSIWTNAFCNLDRYILKFHVIHLAGVFTKGMTLKCNQLTTS